MKISVAVTGDQARSPIPGNLRQATHLFIVDTERFEVLRVLTADEPMDRDVAFARHTIDENCEAIICGEIEERAFELLAEACVSRYNGTGHHASQATKLIKANQLPLIREYVGGPGCAGERSGGECHESSLK
jgi:predicted Fe-Mo cluster-binding NifX family protein